jgi:hydrogenase/urease accessory protein HupE
MTVTPLFLVMGGVLGFFRYKIPILIPAIILTAIGTGSIEIALRQDAWYSALTTIAAMIAIQIGYLGGIAASVLTESAVTTAHEALDERTQLDFTE